MTGELFKVVLKSHHHFTNILLMYFFFFFLLATQFLTVILNKVILKLFQVQEGEVIDVGLPVSCNTVFKLHKPGICT